MSPPFPDARSLLRKYQLSPKKSWGQNFLVAEQAFRRIAEVAATAEDDWVAEIGAGLGTLTMRLAERVPAGKVLAVERDRDMIAVLRGELGHLDNVEIVEADALTYDLAAASRSRGRQIAVCGNLPYHLASQILFRIVAARAYITHAVVMIQREMADRLVAAPGTKQYGALGVLLATYADIDMVQRVGRTAFVPPPKVESAVVRLRLHPGGAPRVPIVDPTTYADVVHAAFQQRRKILRNALRARFAGDAVNTALDHAAIDGGRRGETLTIAEFARLAAALPKPDRHARAS